MCIEVGYSVAVAGLRHAGLWLLINCVHKTARSCGICPVLPWLNAISWRSWLLRVWLIDLQTLEGIINLRPRCITAGVITKLQKYSDLYNGLLYIMKPVCGGALQAVVQDSGPLESLSMRSALHLAQSFMHLQASNDKH